MTTEVTDSDIAPDSIAERLITEIQADPRVRQLVLRALLTDDFLRVPARLEQLAGDFDEFRSETNARFDRVEVRLDTMQGDMSTMQGSIETLQGNVETMQVSIETLQGNVETMQVSVETLQVSVETTQGSVETMQGNMVGLRTDMNAMRGTLGNMRGESYEKKCAENLPVILHQHIIDVAVLDRASIQNELLAARRAGVIDSVQLVDANHVDIVCKGRADESGDDIVGAVEASFTINQNDVDTAHRRADILRQVFHSQRVMAFCVSHAMWSDELAEVAVDVGVILVQHEEPGLIL